jgi:protein-S-isoprenylcysteine O-methyltransferase Ste14
MLPASMINQSSNQSTFSFFNNNHYGRQVDSQMRTLFLALRALIYITGFILLFGWIALAVRTFDQSLAIALPAWTKTVGVVCMVVGGALVIACGGIFVLRGRGTPAIFDPPKEFVAVGPYKYVRNPMYIGGVILIVGFGLYQRSVSILLLSLVLAFLIHFFVLFVEENGLEKRFDSSYLEYRSQ